MISNNVAIVTVGNRTAGSRERKNQPTADGRHHKTVGGRTESRGGHSEDKTGETCSRRTPGSKRKVIIVIRQTVNALVRAREK